MGAACMTLVSFPDPFRKGSGNETSMTCPARSIYPYTVCGLDTTIGSYAALCFSKWFHEITTTVHLWV